MDHHRRLTGQGVGRTAKYGLAADDRKTCATYGRNFASFSRTVARKIQQYYMDGILFWSSTAGAFQNTGDSNTARVSIIASTRNGYRIRRRWRISHECQS